nr:protein argonaute 4A-like [Tanacetum cinerariifolium]
MLILAQKTHHTKFFQQSSDANVPPGIKEAQLPFLRLLLSSMPTWMSQFVKYDELMTCLMQLQAMAVELVVVAVVVLLVSLKSPSFMKRFAALCSSVEQTYE